MEIIKGKVAIGETPGGVNETLTSVLDGSFSRSLFNIVASVWDELNLIGSLQKAFCVRHVTELQIVCNPKKRASFVERIVKESEPCEPSRVKKRRRMMLRESLVLKACRH